MSLPLRYPAFRALGTVRPGPRSISAGGRGASTLLNDLVAYWALEEASGARVDATGRGNDLTDNNTVTQAVGKLGNAAQLVVANSEFLSRTSGADLVMGDIPFTIAGWFNPDSVAPGFQYIISKGSSSIDYEVNLRFDSIEFTFWNGSYSTVNTITGSVVINAWQRFVCWYDPVAARLYLKLNNNADVSIPRVTAPTTTTEIFRMGQRAAGGSFFGGLLDEICMWKRLLTVSEMLDHWNAGVGVTHPFL